jgi:hypothetical protein
VLSRLFVGSFPVCVGPQVVGGWDSRRTHSGGGPRLSPDRSSAWRRDSTVRPVWTLWEVPLGTLLPDGRARARVDGVEGARTSAIGYETTALSGLLAINIAHQPEIDKRSCVLYLCNESIVQLELTLTFQMLE